MLSIIATALIFSGLLAIFGAKSDPEIAEAKFCNKCGSVLELQRITSGYDPLTGEAQFYSIKACSDICAPMLRDWHILALEKSGTEEGPRINLIYSHLDRQSKGKTMGFSTNGR